MKDVFFSEFSSSDFPNRLWDKYIGSRLTKKNCPVLNLNGNHKSTFDYQPALKVMTISRVVLVEVNLIPAPEMKSFEK